MNFCAIVFGGVQEVGQTYSQAQCLQWIDDQRFAVGRWDGSVTIFRRPASPGETGPVIVQALVPPASIEIGWVAVLPTNWLVTSNAVDSLALWRPSGNRFHLARVVKYDPAAGSFNSGCMMQPCGGEDYVSGHANGRIIRWRINKDGTLLPQQVIDIRSPEPVKCPFPLKNVRAVVPWKNQIVITGAEDGDICMVDMSSGKILHRQRYNPTASRGINGLALLGDFLLVSNCTVGTNEPNLWLYRVTDSGITLLDSRYVTTALTIPAVHSMDLALYQTMNGTRFFVSTGEGLLWNGKIENNRLKPLDSILTGKRGVAPVFDLLPHAEFMALADYDIRVYRPEKDENSGNPAHCDHSPRSRP